MEVIHSTNIVFNNQNGRESNDEIGTFKVSKPFRKMKSPKGSRLPKPSKSPWEGLTGLTPIKGQTVDSPVKSTGLSGLPLTPTFESPKFSETPLKGIESSAMGMYESPSPVKERRRVSPVDSGIELPKVLALDSPLSVSPSKINPKIRAMYNGSRRDLEETSDFTINPDPVPYQPSNFMSSTVLKKVPVQRRHLDTFDLSAASPSSKRGLILHTDRYQWDLAKALDGMSQRERLQAELEYMERLRGIKRRREVLPHRAQLDLLMGGKRIEFTERFEIQREIQKLRSLILPQNARDLFHGRGFTLPMEHNSMHPRRTLPPDIDNEELQDATETFPSSKYTFDPETGRAKPKWHKQGADPSMFPKISNKGYLLGHGQPVILSKEKRTVASLKARLHIPTSNTQPAYLTRSKTNVVPAKHASRTFTAIPDHKAKDRPQAATAPVGKAVPRDIKIPVSSREDTDLLSDIQPKPPPPTAADKKPDLEEDTELQNITEDKESRALTSRQSTQQRSTASPSKAPTPNPLRGSELAGALSAEEQSKLKQTFKRLDTDMDGHLLFSQLQSQLLQKFTQTQEKFIKLVYDITSSSTFFGVDEFMTMSYLTNTVTSLSGPALEAYDKIDFHTMRETILQYIELFQSIDRTHKGKISLNSLQDILTAALVTDFKTDSQRWGQITDTLAPSETGQITKIEFLAHIPFFQTLVHNK